MSTMKVIRFFPPGGPEKLKLLDEPVPTLKNNNEVLIKVHAVGLIWPELTWPIYQTTSGEYQSHIPGHDFSGVIVKSGAAVQDAGLQPGAEVWAFTSRRNHEGAMAEYAVADMDQVLPKPKSLSFVQAASIPLSALTAWQGLFDQGKLRKGQRVLITAAAGATGVFATQLAHNIGAHVIGTGSSPESRSLCEQCGVDQFVDYKKDDLKTAVGEVDLVFDCAGGKSFESALSVVSKDGLVVSIVEYDAEEAARKKGIRAIFFIVDMDSSELSAISSQIDEGKVQTIVGRTFTFEKAAEAFKETERGQIRGKVVLEVAQKT